MDRVAYHLHPHMCFTLVTAPECAFADLMPLLEHIISIVPGLLFVLCCAGVLVGAPPRRDTWVEEWLDRMVS